jgi:ADP-ribose pyrophosphatase YjhB (NUDIX family)
MESAFKYCPRCGKPLETRELTGRQRRVCSATCGFVLYDNPTPVVAALVERAGKVLLVRNHGWPETWFGLVTGFLERDETPEAGTLRELKEELGLDGKIERLIGVYDFAQRNELIVAYHVRAEGPIALGAELEAFKEIDPTVLKPWPFGTGHAVSDWLAARRTS